MSRLIIKGAKTVIDDQIKLADVAIKDKLIDVISSDITPKQGDVISKNTAR